MAQAETAQQPLDITSELTAFQQNILTVLAEEPRYGLAVKRELQAYYDEEVNHGRLYPNLDELVELGLVEKNELDKRTNEYGLTADGFAVLLGQLEWVVGKMVADENRAEQVRAVFEQHR